MLLGGVACTPDQGEDLTGDMSEATLAVTPEVCATTLDGDTFTLTVTSNAAWTASCDQDDVQITPMLGTKDGVVTVVVPAATERVFELKFVASKMAALEGYEEFPFLSTAEATVTVYQNATGEDKVQTNVKEIRDLVAAANPGTDKTDLPDEVRNLTLTGIVVGTPNGNMGNDYLLAIQDDTTEPGHGLTISCSGSATNIAKGQVVKVSLAGAKAQKYSGLLQVAVYEAIESIGSPVAVSPIEVAYANVLQYESQYVKVAEKVTPASTAIGKAWNSESKGVNVNFYCPMSESSVRILTFERGVEDFTLACGTGSASVAVVLWLQGKLSGNRLTVENPGGTLEISVEGKNGQIDALYLEGPAETLEEIQI